MTELQKTGHPFLAIAATGRTSEGYGGESLAWMDLSGVTNGEGLAALAHGLEMESEFVDGLIGFDSPTPPIYSLGEEQLMSLVEMLDMPVVLCVVAMDERGRVAAYRRYDGVEVTCLEEARDHLAEFHDSIKKKGLYRPPAMLN